MSDALTQEQPKNGNDCEILTAIKELDTHVTKIDDRLQSLENKVDGLEKKVETRLHDTRPIWHKVVADIAELQSGQKRLEEGQKHLEAGQKGLEEGQENLGLAMSQLYGSVRDVSRDQIITNDLIRRLQMDFHNIDEKLFKLTVKRDQQNSQT